MHFTLWPSARSNEGGYGEISWEILAGFLGSPVEQEDKNALEGWSPVRFRGNRRGLAYVEEVSAIVLDDDKSGLALDALAAAWSGIECVIHTTHSSTAAAPKYRLVFPCSRAMSAEEHGVVWRYMRDQASARGQVLDEGTKDPSRLWYVPAHKKGEVFQCVSVKGLILDIDWIVGNAVGNAANNASDQGQTQIQGQEQHGAPGQTPAPTGERNTPRTIAMAAALGAAWPPKGGGRHEAQLALAGALRAEGFAEADAVDFLCDVCRAAGEEDRPKRTSTVRHTYQKPSDAALTSWTRLKSFVDPVVVDAVRTALGRGAESDERTMRRLAEAATAAGSPAPAGRFKDPIGQTVLLGGIEWEVGGLDAELPPIKWQVDGLIGAGEVVMFVAHGSSLKTWLAFSLAQAIASGRPWLGKFATERGRVGIIDFESGRYEVARRLKMLGVKDVEMGDRLMRVSYPSAKMLDPETWIALAGGGLSLILIDSFNAATPENDENDARSAQMFQLAGKFTEMTGCTVMIIHHARKSTGTGGDERETVRGSTALFAACDRIFAFGDIERAPDGRVSAVMRPLKDGAGRRPVSVRVELSDQGLAHVDTPVEVKETPEDNRAKVIELLKERPAGAPKAAVVDVMIGRRENKFALLSRLVLEGLVVEFKNESKTWIMIRPGVQL